MEIFGHPWIKNRVFKKVFSKEDIAKTTANDIVLFEPLNESAGLAGYCQENNIPYAVAISSVTESLFANALGASYALCQKEEAIRLQMIAQEYLFDTRILVLINSEKEIEKLAQFSIDGVIFPSAISLA